MNKIIIRYTIDLADFENKPVEDLCRGVFHSSLYATLNLESVQKHFLLSKETRDELINNFLEKFK